MKVYDEYEDSHVSGGVSDYEQALQDRITHLEKENDTLYKVVTLRCVALITVASFTIFILV